MKTKTRAHNPNSGAATIKPPSKKFDLDTDLTELLDKIKRQPDLYRPEFFKKLQDFKEKFIEFRENPVHLNKLLEEYMKFFCSVRLISQFLVKFSVQERT